MSAYLDTSAVAKRYLNEPGSDAFDQFLGQMASASISRLTVVEMTCLLARRRRNRELDRAAERRSLAAFESDIAEGYFEVHPLEDRHAISARDLIVSLETIPLRTLDALQLAIGIAIGADVIATADKTFAAAAMALGIKVKWFGSPNRRLRI